MLLNGGIQQLDVWETKGTWLLWVSQYKLFEYVRIKLNEHWMVEQKSIPTYVFIRNLNQSNRYSKCAILIGSSYLYILWQLYTIYQHKQTKCDNLLFVASCWVSVLSLSKQDTSFHNNSISNNFCSTVCQAGLSQLNGTRLIIYNVFLLLIPHTLKAYYKWLYNMRECNTGALYSPSSCCHVPPYGNTHTAWISTFTIIQ